MRIDSKKLQILFWTGTGVSLIWMVQVLLGSMPIADRLLNGLAGELGDTFIYTVFRFLTEFGSREFLVPFVLIMSVLFIISYRSLLPALVFAGGTLLTYGLNGGIKAIIARERPSLLEEANALGYSFPSGHAMISLVCYGLAAYFIAKKMQSERLRSLLQLCLFVLVLLIGISRYVIQVHYITDVFAGFIIGWVLLSVYIRLYETATEPKRATFRE